MIRIAVVGTGYWGKNLVRVFAQTRAAKLHACCDADAGRLALIQRTYPDVRAYTAFDEVLADEEIDAVAIATPSPSHHALALQVLQAGKHVYVEKPLTLRADQSRELIEVADRQKKRLMVGHLLLYHPAVRKLKALIESGELGELYYIYAQRLNLGIVRKDENAWWSLAPHDVSIILHLLDAKPVSVSARGEGYLRQDNPDVVFANLQFPGGRMGQIHVSWLDPHKMRKITVVGSRKMVVFDDMEATEKVKIFDKGVDMNIGYESYGDAMTLRQGDIHIPMVEMEEPLKLECQHFIDCLVNGRNPDTDGINGLHVVEVLEAGQRSLDRDGVPMELR